MHIWDIILKMLFPIGIVAVVIMELNLRQYGNGCLILIIINWNMGQATVLRGAKSKERYKKPRKPKNGKLPKGC